MISPCGSVYSTETRREHRGVKALDVGDADAADTVELRGLIDSLPRIAPLGFPSVSHRFPLAPLQVLDVVKLGELAAVVGRDELLELIRAAGAHPSGLSFG